MSVGKASAILMVAAALAAGCAGPAAPPPSAQPASSPPLPSAVAEALSPPPRTAPVPVVGAVPAARSPAALDALQADLTRRLKPQASAGAIGVLRRSDGAVRVSLDVGRAFEVSSAQMRPETLLSVAESGAAAQVSGAFVIHVIGYGEAASMPDVETLAERRATAVATYLRTRGLPANRVRAEARVSRDRALGQRLDLVYEPIVQGSEVRAWVPPPETSAK